MESLSDSNSIEAVLLDDKPLLALSQAVFNLLKALILSEISCLCFLCYLSRFFILHVSINKYKSYYFDYQFDNLKKNLPHYVERMENNINYFEQALNSKGFKNTIIDKIIFHDDDLFHENNYHLNLKGHEKLSNAL